MGRSLRVKGSLMPAAGCLKRDEEAVYADGPHVRSLIAKGHLVLLNEIYSDDEDAPEPDVVDQLKNIDDLKFEDTPNPEPEADETPDPEPAPEKAKTTRRGAKANPEPDTDVAPAD